MDKPDYSIAWSVNGFNDKPADSKIATGWVVEIPSYQQFNWILNRADTMLQHYNTHGIPAWDNKTNYIGGRSYVQASNGVIYRAVRNNTNINPATDTNSNWELPFGAAGDSLLKSNNLSDVPNKDLARTNLGVLTQNQTDGRYLKIEQNLADVPNKATARSVLGLGNSAVRNVGTATNTVAAGDDSRIVNAVPNSRRVSAGNGLGGGGVLSGDIFIAMHTPNTISMTSPNDPGTPISGHSHAIDVNSLNPGVLEQTGWTKLPGGLIMQWGVGPRMLEGTQSLTFPIPFPSLCFNVQLTPIAESWHAAGELLSEILSIDRSGFTYGQGISDRQIYGRMQWIAIGK